MTQTNSNIGEIISAVTLLVTPIVAGAQIGYAPQSTNNLLYEGKFPLPIVKVNGRRMVRVADLTKYVDGLKIQTAKPKLGRPTNKSKLVKQSLAANKVVI